MAKGCKFTVRGSGRFPVDMLRYDRCFPTSTEAVMHIAHQLRDGEGVEQYRSVELATDWTSTPTVSRWRSFGWEVVS
jgi:hypothetical protein